MSANIRGFVWLDESVERSDQEEARAAALANKWSQLHHKQEQRTFASMQDIEDGRDYGPELDLCDECGGDVEFGVACSNPDCVDGYDEGPIRGAERRQREHREELDLEIEFVEDKLSILGARMMRPYEHHNEDERRVQYAEEDFFGY